MGKKKSSIPLEHLSDAIEKDIVEKSERARLQQMMEEGRVHFDEVFGLQAQVIECAGRAEEITDRHNGLLRCICIVNAISNAASGDTSELRFMRRLIRGKGAFLMQMSYDEARNRLASDRWVVAEAEGGRTEDSIRRASDCQVLLSEDESDGETGMRMPDKSKGDTIWEQGGGERIFDAIKADHGIAACVMDICTEDKLAQSSLAGAARHEAFSHIVSNINPQRKHPIRYVGAEIFNIHGVELPNGERRMLNDMEEAPIGNSASFWIHQHSKRWPAELAAILRQRNVDVYMPREDGLFEEKPHKLIIDWLLMVHDLEKSQPKQ